MVTFSLRMFVNELLVEVVGHVSREKILADATLSALALVNATIL